MEIVIERIKQHWRGALARLPLPMLAIPASYGVYEFTALFVPGWVAIIQAAAFETVYVGLAAYDNLSRGDKWRALAISAFAVLASVAYNTLAGMFRLDPSLLQEWQSDLAGVAILSALHGVPLALLAFLVSNFTLHGSIKKDAPPVAKKKRATGRGLVRVVKNHGENVPTVAIERPPESAAAGAQTEYADPRLLPPPVTLPADLQEAVLLYATHKSFANAAKYSKYSRETIRTRFADARKAAPEWVAAVCGATTE